VPPFSLLFEHVKDSAITMDHADLTLQISNRQANELRRRNNGRPPRGDSNDGSNNADETTDPNQYVGSVGKVRKFKIPPEKCKTMTHTERKAELGRLNALRDLSRAATVASGNTTASNQIRSETTPASMTISYAAITNPGLAGSTASSVTGFPPYTDVGNPPGTTDGNLVRSTLSSNRAPERKKCHHKRNYSSFIPEQASQCIGLPSRPRSNCCRHHLVLPY
jgi:hypothetical protein